MTKKMTRRAALVGAGSTATAFATIGMLQPARAATKVRFLTSWFAIAEHGGYYHAKATGIYDKYGLDVTITPGGPQVNNAQILAAGETDMMMGWDIQTLQNVEKGVPMIDVAAPFQRDLQGFITHPNITSPEQLKGHPIQVVTSAYTTWWPWAKERFGFTQDQAQPYNFTYDRFISDPNVAVQGYVTYDEWALGQVPIPSKFFWFGNYGYPSYGSPIVVMQPYLEKNRDTVARFVRATMEGWKGYLANPAPGNVLIKEANPKVPDGQLAFTVGKMKSIGFITGGDAAKGGIGTMSDVRWKATRDLLVKGGIIKDTTDWKSAYTLEYIRQLHITV